jgi:hypothetical protein
MLQLLAIHRPIALKVIDLYARHAILPILRKLEKERIARIAVMLSGALLGLASYA